MAVTVLSRRNRFKVLAQMLKQVQHDEGYDAILVQTDHQKISLPVWKAYPGFCSS
jgi:hypothetical protein